MSTFGFSIFFPVPYMTSVLYLIFTVALAENGKFLLGARKSRHATFTEYIISLNADDMSKGSSAYIGKLKCVLISYLFDV